MGQPPMPWQRAVGDRGSQRATLGRRCHRGTEERGWQETVGTSSPSPGQAGGQLRTVSCWRLCPFEDGASTTCLGSPFPFLVTLP